jgi:Carboxypeptidase regulatory-like domain
MVFVAMLCLALGGSGQTTKPGGRISGHVYRADSHAPLADVTMTLQVTNDVVASVQTAADGTYFFDGLDAKYYTLAAWKTGFVGRYYGVNRPNRGSAENLQIVQGSPLDGIDFSLQPEPGNAQMADSALSEAHPDLRPNLGFEGGRFSPDGSEFAFGVTNIETGDTDEIWLYDLRNERLRRVAAGPGPYVWGSDARLYTSFVSDRKRYVVATPDAISEIDQPPSDVAAAFARWRPGRDDVRHAGEYAVSAENQGHGFFHLLLRSPAIRQAHVIASGSWELETFLLNPSRRQVLYPETGWFGSIVTYDLRTGQSRALDFQSGEGLRLLDLTGDGKLLAYSVTGPCGQNVWNYQWLLYHRERRAANVCFIRPE